MLARRILGAIALALAFAAPAAGGTIGDRQSLERELRALAERHPGRVGICAQEAGREPVCVNGDARFSLQSVMKLVVGAAVLHAVDEGRMRLDDRVVARRQDMSVFVQPIETIVARQGSFDTDVADLLRRAVAQSDSAAVDILVDRLGGPRDVQRFLESKGMAGLRVDRTERDLQTEIVGLRWTADYVHPERLQAAIKAVPKARRDAAYAAYLKDERDTATPRAMAGFLHALAAGRLLSPASTAHLLRVMRETSTFPDRLRAGTPPGWMVAHKTGTSASWNGVAAATNDVGLLTAPDGGTVAVAAFVADSTAPLKERNALIAAAARAVTAAYR